MKKYFLFLLFTSISPQLLGEAINFAQSIYVAPLKKSFYRSIDLWKSRFGRDYMFFTTRTILRLGAERLSEYEQKALRNEICASSAIAEIPGRDGAIGSIGIYRLNQRVVSISDSSFAGRPLASVLRELAVKPSEQKRFFAKYYAVNMAYILSSLDRANVIWNNLDLRNFYVNPNGKLHAFDFSDAVRDPATRDADKQKQRNHFMASTLRHLYYFLFPDEDDSLREYEALITNGLGTDPRVVNNAEETRTHNWTLKEILALLASSLGQKGPYDDDGQPFAGGIDAELSNHDTTRIVNEFYQQVGFFLNRANHRPYIPTSAMLTSIASIDQDNLYPPSHEAELQDNRGSGGFGIAEDVRTLFIEPETGRPRFDGLNAMCNTWTGR